MIRLVQLDENEREKGLFTIAYFISRTSERKEGKIQTEREKIAKKITDFWQSSGSQKFIPVACQKLQPRLSKRRCHDYFPLSIQTVSTPSQNCFLRIAKYRCD